MFIRGRTLEVEPDEDKTHEKDIRKKEMNV